MIIRNFTYKGISLADSVAWTTKIVIQSVDKWVQLRTAIFDRVNYHGANSSYTLASGRLFTVQGVIFWNTRADRATGQTTLNNIIAPESTPTATNRGFYTLTWTDDSGNAMTANTKVYSMPTYKHENGTDLIEFTFELYSEEAYYTWTVDKTGSGGYGLMGGFSLPSVLPVAFDDLIWSFTITNLWNFASPCKIEVVGTVVAPKIYNVTSNVFYGVSSTTSDFIVDNRGSSNAIITDAGVDVSAYRTSGSKYISIVPGANVILLQGSNYSMDSAVTVTVTYRDTYISS